MAKKKTKITVIQDGQCEEVELEVDEELLQPVDDFWCTCEKQTESQYWPDEFDEAGRLVSKHHWSCLACGRVTQIG
jgi:hypothetical protein